MNSFPVLLPGETSLTFYERVNEDLDVPTHVYPDEPCSDCGYIFHAVICSPHALEGMAWCIKCGNEPDDC